MRYQDGVTDDSWFAALEVQITTLETMTTAEAAAKMTFSSLLKTTSIVMI